MFDITDYIIEMCPGVAHEILVFTIPALSVLKDHIKVLIFNAYLITYAENLAYYFYMIYLPILIVKKGMEHALKLVFIGCVILFIIQLKWQVQDWFVEGGFKVDTLAEKAVFMG